jgi:D-alanyl-D-alanine dipeptidase
MKRTLAVSLAFVLAAAGSAQPGTTAKGLGGSKQLMVVTTPDWEAVDGRLQRFERKGDEEPWRAVGVAVPVVVGKSGMAWGLGTVPADRLRLAGDPVKREGDGKTPAGVFALGTAFGFAGAEPAAWKMPYLTLTPTIDCVDDPDSSRYNRIADRAAMSPDWNSAEHMRAVGENYRWGAVIEQNPADVKNAGSCVFLHVWSGAGQGTAGCTAMAKPLVETLLGWLDPAAQPMLVEMPAAQYTRLRKQLGLPALMR